MPLLLVLFACAVSPFGPSASGDADATVRGTAAPLASPASGAAATDVAQVDRFPTDRYTLGTRLHTANLTVWTVTDGRPATTGDYVTLAAGLADGSVGVSEVDGSGSVPQLLVENRGDRAVFLAAGDVVTGGKQDRVVVADLVLPAHTGPQPVAVNCVEHGRWTAERGDLRFGYGGRAEGGLKETLQVEKDQSRTWAKVEQLNRAKATKLGVLGEDVSDLAPSTGTYRASLEADAVVERVTPYVTALTAGLAGPTVVGVVVAFDGDLAGAELFGSPALFAASRDALVRSVALDAISRPTTGAPAPDDAAAAAFLHDTLTGTPGRTELAGAARRVESESPTTRGYGTVEADGDLVHLTTYRK